MWTIFQVFIEFITIFLLFYVFFFWLQACGIFAWPGAEPTHPTLEGGFLITGMIKGRP